MRVNKMKAYVYHYVCYSKGFSAVELFSSDAEAWKSAAAFLRLRISDAEYFGRATQNDYHISRLLEQENLEEACALFNIMQADEKLEILERLVS
jgi:hypothetical protein